MSKEKEGKMISISHGREIRLEKTWKTIIALRRKVGDLYSQVLALASQREKLLDEEYAKPVESQDHSLIETLRKEIKDLEEVEDATFKRLHGILKKENEVRDEWLTQVTKNEITDLREEIQKIEEKISELRKGKPEQGS